MGLRLKPQVHPSSFIPLYPHPQDRMMINHHPITRDEDGLMNELSRGLLYHHYPQPVLLVM